MGRQKAPVKNKSGANFISASMVGSHAAWPPLLFAEPAVLWESPCQLRLAVSDTDQNETAVTRWSLTPLIVLTGLQ